MKSARKTSPSRLKTSATTHREHSFALLIILGMLIMFVVIGIGFFAMNMNKKYDNVELSLKNANSKNMFIFPTSKDTLIKGQSYTIRWDGGPATIEQLDLVNRAYEKEGVSISLVDRFYNFENKGFYEVTIPTEIPDGQYKFQMGPMSSEYFNLQEK